MIVVGSASGFGKLPLQWDLARGPCQWVEPCLQALPLFLAPCRPDSPAIVQMELWFDASKLQPHERVGVWFNDEVCAARGPRWFAASLGSTRL